MKIWPSWLWAGVGSERVLPGRRLEFWRSADEAINLNSAYLLLAHWNWNGLEPSLSLGLTRGYYLLDQKTALPLGGRIWLPSCTQWAGAFPRRSPLPWQCPVRITPAPSRARENMFSSVVTPIHDVQKRSIMFLFINLKFFPFSVCPWETQAHWIFLNCLLHNISPLSSTFLQNAPNFEFL